MAIFPILKKEETCLLIIDMQNDFVKPNGYLGKHGCNMKSVIQIVPPMAFFLKKCRVLGIPRVFARTIHSNLTDTPTWVGRLGKRQTTAKLCIPGTWGTEIVSELRPRKDEPVVTKYRYDAFLNTDLSMILRRYGTKNLLICGTKTNVCVDTTARHAFQDDFVTITVKDCVATPDDGMQEVTLRNLKQHFGYVVNSNEILKKLKRN